MTTPLRILIADDSAVVRRLVSETISRERNLEVVGGAKNGKEALELLDELKPDVVVLDVEMPVMDGLTALKRLRQKDRWLPVLMFSSTTVSGAAATLDALSLGANDYVAKPSRLRNIGQVVAYLQQELVPKVLYWGKKARRTESRPGSARSGKVSTHRTRPVALRGGHRASTDIVAIGASTGGPDALAEILSAVPLNLQIPIVVVQHMPPVFTRLLAERLNRECQLSVREAEHGTIIHPGEVWIAPGDHHMIVSRKEGQTRLLLNQNSEENSCRPSVDVLFRSIAEVYGRNALGIVLTGMGIDGTEGCRVMSEAGAYIVAQDEDSSVVWGMPRSVAEKGFADRVRQLTDIATEIAVSSRSGSRAAV